MARPTRKQTAEREKQYREMYDAGLTCVAIAEKVGVSASAVAQWCRRNGLAPHGVGNVPAANRAALDAATEVRPVADAPGYTVSQTGRVYSDQTDPPREMTARVHQGQWRVSLSVGGRVRYRYVADLVLTAWSGPRPDGCVIGWRDGDRLNAAADNLEWRDGRARIDLVELVRVWQSSSSVLEVCERMAASYQTVTGHVARLRADGVPLKQMRPDADLDDLMDAAASG